MTALIFSFLIFTSLVQILLSIFNLILLLKLIEMNTVHHEKRRFKVQRIILDRHKI